MGNTSIRKTSKKESNSQSWIKKDALATGRAWFENDIENKGKIAKDETITFPDLCMKFKVTSFYQARVSSYLH